jgi:multisubunit Na+/H+ antiporter MnhC subunit
MAFSEWTKAKKFHHSVLLVGGVASVVVFNLGMELVSAGIITVSIVLMALTNRFFDGPVYDERDLSLAKDSTHKALMLTGVLGGIAMLVISIGMGLDMWSYPYWVAPYYLTWGAILLISMIIESLKRFGVDV